MTTPAQAYGHPDFIESFGPGGPTDEGMRKADCWYVQNQLPSNPASCVDCEGTIPMWAQHSLYGLGERVMRGDVGVLGFSVGVGGEEVWTSLTPDQQAWVADTFNRLNTLIIQTTGTQCPSWGPSVTAAGGCFQGWFNSAYGGALTRPDGSPMMLRTDGEFDQDTLDALITVAGLHPQDFPNSFPSDDGAPVLATEKKKVSTAAMVGIASVGVLGIGVILFAATRRAPGKRRSRRKKRR